MDLFKFGGTSEHDDDPCFYMRLFTKSSPSAFTKVYTVYLHFVYGENKVLRDEITCSRTVRDRNERHISWVIVQYCIQDATPLLISQLIYGKILLLILLNLEKLIEISDCFNLVWQKVLFLTIEQSMCI